MIQNPAAARARMAEAAILSASPQQLVVMLYDRLILDLNRAAIAQRAADWNTAREQLLHAQAIVANLQGSLDMTVWDGADGLMAIYHYVNQSMVAANIHRDAARTIECIALLEPLRDAWKQALEQQASTAQPVAAGAL